MQYPEDRLPDEWEAGLKHPRRQLTSMAGAVSRFAYLSHLYRVRSERLETKEGEDAEDLIGKMLMRASIPVQIAGRTVHVKGRSMNAMAEIAAHSLTIQELTADLKRIADIRAEGRHLKRISRIQRRVVLELDLHRRAIYAHAFTESGAPAASLADCPAWFEEVRPSDDSRIMQAMWMANNGRIARLHDALPDQEPDHGKKAVTFGWHTMLATLAPKMKVTPARMYDVDLPHALAFAHASNPTFEDLE